MIDIFITSFRIKYTEITNYFINFLQHIPLLGKKIPRTLFSDSIGKTIISIIAFIQSLGLEFIKKILYIGIFIALPAKVLSEAFYNGNQYKDIFFHIYFVSSFLFGSLMNSKINTLDKINYIMVSMLRVDARKHYLSQIIYKLIKDTIFLALPICIFIGVKSGILILLLLNSYRIIGESIILYLYSNFGIRFDVKKVVTSLLIIVVLPALAYGIPALEYHLNINNIINMYSIVITMIISFLFSMYLYRNRSYGFICREINSRENIFNGEKAVKNIQANGAMNELKKMNLQQSKVDRINSSGFQYLNRIFFIRHKRLITGHLRIKVLIIIVATIITAIALNINNESRGFIDYFYTKGVSILVLIMYIASDSQELCKALFFNCDLSLLRYSYYKEPKNIVKNFSVRLKTVVILNSVPALLISFSILILTIISSYNVEISKLVPVMLLPLMLSCFFSIFYLFMYYIVQPFTKDMTIKSPIYFIINFVMYMFCLYSNRIPISPAVYTTIVVGIVIIFIPIALYSVYKFAPKTFRIK